MPIDSAFIPPEIPGFIHCHNCPGMNVTEAIDAVSGFYGIPSGHLWAEPLVTDVISGNIMAVYSLDIHADRIKKKIAETMNLLDAFLDV